MKRNLIYFIYYPGYLTHYHHLNLKLLKEYIHIFDGKVIITIATDGEYKMTELINLLPQPKSKLIKIRMVKNDRVNWEASHFLDALHQVSDGVTLYGHCKGVSRNKMNGLDIWIQKLYAENLQNPPDMNGKVFSGICAKLLPCPPYVPFDFHYSGSFYWMDTAVVKKRFTTAKITPSRYLTESLPAMIAKKEECEFRYYSTEKNENFYNWSTWLKIQESFVIHN